MAYCVGTLVEILEQILHPDKHHKTWVLDPDKRPQVQSLFENALFLRNFLANSSRESQAKLEFLEDRIRDVVEKAEDVLEKHIAELVLSTRSWSQSFTISPPDLQQVIDELEMTKGTMMEIEGVSSESYNTSHVISCSYEEPDPDLEKDFTMDRTRKRIDDLYSDLEECLEMMKAEKDIVLKYMEQLINITELDSEPLLTSLSRAHVPDHKNTFVEINNDLDEVKNRLIALNLEIFADIASIERVGKTVLNQSNSARTHRCFIFIMKYLLSAHR